jgi:hypothetical protein
VAAILLTAAWFLVQPSILEAPPAWLRWAVGGAVFGLLTVVGVGGGALRAPSRLVAALSIDSRFDLKERITTSFTLPREQEQTPAGQALLADVASHIQKIDVGSRFPVRLSWSAGLVPVCAGLLAFIAAFYNPGKSQAISAADKERLEPPSNLAEIKDKMKLRQKKDREKLPASKLDDLAKFESEMDKIFSKPVNTKEEVRERIKEMTSLEEAMKQKEKEMADRTRSLKQQLQRMDRMSQSNSEGPAKDLDKALSEGKFDKAREELERLAKKLQANQLSAKDKEQLKKQLEEMQKKLERVAKMKDKEDQLRKANLDPETLKRELEQLKKDSMKMKDLQDLAQQLGQCQKALKEGNMDNAMDTMAKAGDKLKSMKMDEEDLQDLREQLSSLQNAKDSC